MTSKFQFNYGAIGTFHLLLFDLLLYRFNSIMVRLEHGAAQAAYATNTAFQFHYGAIGTKADFLDGQTELCFNSIMVRLELCCCAYKTEATKVSIPLWCDWN